MPALLASALLAAALLVAACAKPNPARAEAGRVIGEIDRIGRTAAPERGPLLDALAQREIAAPNVREVRDRCVEAYRQLGRAQTELKAAEAQVDGATDPDAARAVLQRMESAQGALEAARKAHEACRTALGALRAKTPE